jgi:hypothetical protein
MAAMRISGRATLGVASLFATTCSGSTEPAVGVSAVAPASAYNDETVSIVIEGGPFRAAYDIDTSAGRAMTQLGAFTAFLSPTAPSAQRVAVESLTWLSPSALAAVLPSHIAAGVYDVEVRDPRGALALLPQGFVSLGPDVTPPMLSIVEPASGTVVNAGAEVPVAFSADDGPGRLDSMRWQVSSPDIDTLSGTCPLGPDAQQATCRFVFVVPRPAQMGQALNVIVEATDGAGRVGRAQTTLAVGVAPKVTGFSPIEGPAVGGTTITVTGDNFISGSQILVDGLPLWPQGGTVTDNGRTISGTTTAHGPGLFPLAVQTGAIVVKAAAAFEYVGQPQLRAVSPSSGPPGGGTLITIVGKNFRERKTIFGIGPDAESAVELGCLVYVSPNRVQGYAPPGAGAASIFAHDPVGGDDVLPIAFTYLSDDSPDAATGAPACDGGPP